MYIYSSGQIEAARKNKSMSTMLVKRPENNLSPSDREDEIQRLRSRIETQKQAIVGLIKMRPGIPRPDGAPPLVKIVKEGDVSRHVSNRGDKSNPYLVFFSGVVVGVIGIIVAVLLVL